MLLSDFCNQRAIHAHAKRPIPERGAFAATDRPRARCAFVTKAHASHGRRRPLLSSYLAVATEALRPQVDARLTTPIELRFCFSRAPLFQGAENRSGRCSRTAAFSTACTVEMQTPLSSLSRRRLPASRQRRHQNRLWHPLVKGERQVKRRRMTSIDECPHRHRSRGYPFGPATDPKA
jgi:hypothetical protein